MLGVVFAIAAAVALGGATVLQHRAATAVPLQAGGTLKLSVRLMGTPSWLVGKAFDGVALGFQTLALAHAGLASVQAVLVSGVAVSLGLEAALHRRAPDHRAILGVVILIAGTALLVGVGRPSRGRAATAPLHWVVAVAVVTMIVVVAVWTAAGATARIAGVTLALATAACFALDAAFLKEVARGGGHHGPSAVLACLGGFLLAAIAGNVLVQRAFQLAPLAVTMPALTAAEPLGGLALGALLYHEHLTASGLARPVAVLGGFLLVAGAVLAASTAAVPEPVVP
jgi:drug/metabolite transporter (DMT)-like permease